MVFPIHVINLDQDVERMETMKRQLDGLSLPFVRFSAVRGHDIPSPIYSWWPEFIG